MNRCSIRRELALSRAQHLAGRSQVGRDFSLEQGQPHAVAPGNQDWEGGYPNGSLGYAQDAQPFYHPHEVYVVYGPGSYQGHDTCGGSYGEESGATLQLFAGAGAEQDCHSWVGEGPPKWSPWRPRKRAGPAGIKIGLLVKNTTPLSEGGTKTLPDGRQTRV